MVLVCLPLSAVKTTLVFKNSLKYQIDLNMRLGLPNKKHFNDGSLSVLKILVCSIFTQKCREIFKKVSPKNDLVLYNFQKTVNKLLVWT